jgi:DNA-binding NarL/FixJ family response regulator
MSRQPSFLVTLVGKNSLLKEGIEKILRSANFRILPSSSSAQVRPARKSLQDRQLLLIVQAGDEFDGLIKQIVFFRSQHPAGRIAIVADCYRLDQLVSVFRAGAHGYFVDLMRSDAFVKSIELIIMGETIVPPALLSAILDRDGYIEDKVPLSPDNSQTIIATSEDGVAPPLSPRERAILRCLIDGDSNKSIARKIDIAEATVKVHVKAILRKIRVHNRTQAAIWGINNEAPAQKTGTESSQAKELSAPAEADAGGEQIAGSTSSALIERKTNRTDVPGLDCLIRKGTARLRK